MAELTLNNQSLSEKYSEDSTLNDLMDVIQEKYVNDDQFFTEVLIDGVAISPEKEVQILTSPVSNYSQIDFTVKSSAELAIDALETCSKHLDTLIEKITIVSQSYRENRVDLANKQFVEITEILELFVELITTIHQTLRVESETVLPSGRTIQDLEMHLLSVLKALVPAREKGDIIMLCDLLEYELIDNLTQWKIMAIPELKRIKTI